MGVSLNVNSRLCQKEVNVCSKKSAILTCFSELISVSITGQCVFVKTMAYIKIYQVWSLWQDLGGGGGNAMDSFCDCSKIDSKDIGAPSLIGHWYLFFHPS